MITYDLAILDVEASIKKLTAKIYERGKSNTVRVFINQHKIALEDAQECQKISLHRYLTGGHCSCGLSVEVEDDEPFSITQERVFRARGHVDHVKGDLTKLFVRKWPAINNDGEFFCWCLVFKLSCQVRGGYRRIENCLPCSCKTNRSGNCRWTAVSRCCQ